MSKYPGNGTLMLAVSPHDPPRACTATEGHVNVVGHSAV